MNSPKKAFTLVELLVVIAIIGVLTSIAVIALGNARAKARDVKRLSDAKQVQTALELYFFDMGRYPTAAEYNSGSIASYSSSTGVTTTYMTAIPVAANPPDGGCSANQNNFSYEQTRNGGGYTLSLCLGGQTGNLNSGRKCLTANGFSDTDCFICGDTVQYDGGPYDSTGTAKNQGGYYRTVYVDEDGGQDITKPGECWMRDNMNAGTQIIPYISHVPGRDNCTSTVYNSNTWWSCQQDANIIKKFCYQDSPALCDSDGGMYEWQAALRLPDYCFATDCASLVASPRQGICPSGWHVTTDADQYFVENALKDPGNSCVASRNGAFDCNPAAVKMRVGGSSELDILWDGVHYSYDNSYRYRDLYYGAAYMMASEQGDLHHCVNRLYHYSYDGPDRFTTRHKTDATMVRCVKD